MHVKTQTCILFLLASTLTFVRSQDCTLEQFINSRLYDSNFDITDLEASYHNGRQVRVSCNVGFSGFFRLFCVEGRWMSRGNKCQPRPCGYPGDAQFAEFHLAQGDDFVFGSQVEYTCRKGYQMITRTNYRNCMADGWDGVVPVCERMYSSTCTAPTIENGDVLGDIKEYSEHEVLQFLCHDKYKPAEERSPKCTKRGTTADWSPTPLCEPIKCKLPPPLGGTRYDPAYRNVFSPGDTVSVICGERYWISNPQEASAVVTCREDGDWSVRPICREVTCSRPRDPHLSYINVYWGQQIRLGDTARYQCRRGYKSTDGTDQATCTRDEWRPNPLCQEITCEPVEIPNAELVNPKWRYKNGQKANYVCKDGYRGNPTRTCGENGWTGYSECRGVVGCGTPPFLANGNIRTVVKSQYSHNESVEYMCLLYYTMEGEPYRTCINGEWIGQQRCLKPCVVDEKKIGQHNIALKSGDITYYTHDEIIEFKCARGIPVGEVAMRQRCNSGVILLPTCQ